LYTRHFQANLLPRVGRPQAEVPVG